MKYKKSSKSLESLHNTAQQISTLRNKLDSKIIVYNEKTVFSYELNFNCILFYSTF